MCERGAVRQHRSRETSGPTCQAPGMRSLWVNGFGAGGPLGESVRKAEVSGLAAQGRKKEQERKLLPGLVWGVGRGRDENASF